MKLASRLRAAVSGLVTGKSFAASVAAWRAGTDSDSAPATRLTQPYNQSGIVHAAINLVSGEFTGLPLDFYQGENEFDDPALAAWWAAPALGPDLKRLSRAEVDRWLALWLQLEGEFFLLLDDAWVVSAGRNAASLPPFIIARPNRVRLIIQGGQLAGYAYSDAAGRQHVFVPAQVIHVKEPNPLDDWRGLGRATVARMAAESSFLTGVYIRDLMRNNGDQGMVVIGKAGVATEEQRAQIAAALAEKRRALRAGIAKDIFLGGDITVERKQEEAASVDLTNTRNLSHQEIFLTFGVPPSMSQVKAAYSIGKDSDRYQLITGTSQPLARLIAGAYGELASRQTGRVLTAAHDWDDHPVMQEVRNSRLDSALKLWAAGMPWEKINEYLSLGMAPFPGWEIAYLPFSVAPVGDAAPAQDPAQDPALAENIPVDPDIAKIKALLSTRSRLCKNVTPAASVPSVPSDPFALFACQCHGAALVAQKADRPAKELSQWRALMAARRDTVKSFEGAFGRVLLAARQETLRKLESVTGKTAVAKASAFDIVFDLAKFTQAFTATMRDRQKLALATAGKQLFAEVGKDDPFAYPPEEVLNFLAARENKLKDTPREIHEEIKATIEQGLVDGDTQEQLAARVRTSFNGVSSARARRIALTETAAAYGAGRDEAMIQAGVQYKRWLTSGNDNVRSAHAAANGQTVAIDEAFTVDGEPLMFPGDDSGSPGNVINCHCVSIATTDAPDS